MRHTRNADSSSRALRGATLTLCAMFAGCAAATPDPEPSETAALESSPLCRKLYTYAPGFLMVDVTAGSHVTLNPGLRDFPVFCTAQQAYDYLVDAIATGRVPHGDWLVYSLNGGLELARETSPGNLLLARPARLTDWFSMRTLQAAAENAPAAAQPAVPATGPAARIVPLSEQGAVPAEQTQTAQPSAPGKPIPAPVGKVVSLSEQGTAPATPAQPAVTREPIPAPVGRLVALPETPAVQNAVPQTP